MNAYDLAQKEVGTVEWTKGDNPKVVAYFKDSGNAGVTTDSTAWCAAFVGAMLARSGIKGTGKLNARSYLDWGVHVARQDAQPGDVVIFKRGNSSWQGHVAFFVKDRGAKIDVLGGNQSDAVNVKGYAASQLLGIRRAKASAFPPVSQPKTKTSEAGGGTSANTAPQPGEVPASSAPAPVKNPATGPVLIIGGIGVVIATAWETLVAWWDAAMRAVGL